MPLPASTRQHSGTASLTVDTIQRYARIMNDVLETYFWTLKNVPDILYIMMATMELESSFRILHNDRSTASHISPSVIANNLYKYTKRGIGKAYWNDPAISLAKTDPAKYTNVLEGLSAQALMGSMGMYQVRNTRISNELMTQRNYYSIASSNNLLVNPGESPSSVFTNNDDGAKKSMILGCMDMEWKYSIYLRRCSPNEAIKRAVGSYLGEENVADVLGSTPEMRVNSIFYAKNSINSVVNVSRVFSTGVFTPPKTASGQIETKSTVVATTDNLPTNSNGCNRV